MKLKLLLVAVFVAGFSASFALASSEKGHDPTTTGTTTTSKKPKCAQVELKGDSAAGSFAFTVKKANKSGSKLVGQQVTLTIAAGDKVKAKACTTTGSSALTLRELHVDHHQTK
jgi:hypothetical protein